MRRSLRQLSAGGRAAGPLAGVRVLELEGLAAAPLCGHLLSGFGADVVRVDQAGRSPTFGTTAVGHGKRSVALDLKAAAGRETMLRLCDRADVLIEPYRPGVMERLGLGPVDLHATNPRLVYARLTGWGQTGAYAHTAGHDINYIAISGALGSFVRPGERPSFPVNLLGDFAGGTLNCAFGIALALLERERSGRGQVVDAAMVDGAAYLTSFLHRMRHEGVWDAAKPGANLLDGGSPFYDTYTCSDGGHVAVGCIEPQFYALMLKKLELDDDPEMQSQMDRRAWPRMRAKLASTFLTRSRDAWAELFEGSDACVSPVLRLDEAPDHTHNASRGTFAQRAGESAPWVATPPMLGRTPARPPAEAPPCEGVDDVEHVLREWSAAKCNSKL